MNFRPVVGYEGLYEISEQGQVRNVKTNKIKKVNHLKGYAYTNLFKNGKCRYSAIHRLLAMAFIPNPNGYKQVNHINGIKSDNRLDNLEWCDNSKNMLHCNYVLNRQTGFAMRPVKVKLGYMIKDYPSLMMMCREYDLQWANLSSVLSGRRKSHKGFKKIGDDFLEWQKRD